MGGGQAPCRPTAPAAIGSFPEPPLSNSSVKALGSWAALASEELHSWNHGGSFPTQRSPHSARPAPNTFGKQPQLSSRAGPPEQPEGARGPGHTCHPWSAGEPRPQMFFLETRDETVHMKLPDDSNLQRGLFSVLASHWGAFKNTHLGSNPQRRHRVGLGRLIKCCESWPVFFEALGTMVVCHVLGGVPA